MFTSGTISATKLLRPYITKSPFLYSLYLNIFNNKLSKLFVQNYTDIVISGYGGSGNTFATHAFNTSQLKNYIVSHHLHVPALILRSTQLQIPTVVISREPVACLASTMSRGHVAFNPESIYYSLKDYTTYYRTISPYADKFVIAKLEDISENFPQLLQRINDAFNSDFSIPVNFEKQKQKSLDKITLGKPGTARTIPKKVIINEIKSERYSKYVSEALTTYQNFLNLPTAFKG